MTPERGNHIASNVSGAFPRELKALPQTVRHVVTWVWASRTNAVRCSDGYSDADPRERGASIDVSSLRLD